MGFDRKYGRVSTEHGDIPDDEPVIVFRGHDPALVPMLDTYLLLCTNLGAPDRHLNIVQNSREAILAWQQANPDRMKVPDSERSREWMAGE